jgi:DNA-binding winged helix-turn-helix (wHTH) protein
VHKELMKRTIQFGAFELNLETGELRKSGVRVKLQGKAFQILQALLEHPGEVVTRDELKNRLWPGDTFVDFESGLNTAANRLRLTLGDSAENPRYIETVARTGYRFIGSISEIAVTSHEPTSTVTLSLPVATAPSESSQRKHLWWLAIPVALCISVLAVWMSRRPSAPPNFRQVTFRQGVVSGARFGPDGQTILYSARWDGGNNQVFLANTVSPESRTLDFRRARLASISSTSELALLFSDPKSMIRGGTLSRVPLNGGAPLTIATGIAGAEWAPDGKNLAVVRIGNRESIVEYPIGKVIFRTSGTVTNLRISPRGDVLAFLEHPLRGDDAGSVKIIDRQGVDRSLSTKWASCGGLAWSPSGSEVWFTAGPVGLRRGLYAVTLEGKLRQVATLPGMLTLFDISKTGRVLMSIDRSRMMIAGAFGGDENEKDLTWFDWSHASDISRDGKLVLFDETGDGGGANHSVYLRNVETSSTVRLGDGLGLTLSPDLKWALSLNPKKPGELALLPLGPESPRSLPGRGLEYAWAQFFPDGKRLLVSGNFPGKPLRLYIQPLSGGDPVPLGPDAYLTNAVISPDGQRIAGVNQDRKAVILPASGGQSQELMMPFAAAPLRWSRDGKSLYVQDLECFIPARIARYEIATGRSQTWKEIAPSNRTGIGYFLNVMVGEDEKSYAYSYLREMSELFVVDGWQ